MRDSRRFRDILDRVATDEVKTLAAIGGGELSALSCAPILEKEAGFVVRAIYKGELVNIENAPGILPELLAVDGRMNASRR